MKPTRLVPIVVFSAIIASSCDQRSDTNNTETAKQLAALEQKAEEAIARQLELERELAGREAIAINNEQINEEPAPAGDYGMFYDSLSSYGSWFETPDYGYVWQPVIVRDVSWRPYTRGRWACSDHGWTWISDEPFGWATYHYGRWALCKGRGWIWVPGSQWAPSWVSWRSSGSHIGWAPLPPETLAYVENRWDSNVDATFGIGAPWYCFVETRYFGNAIHHHCLPFDRNPIFIQQTINITHVHVRNRRIICGGPTYGDVSKQVERQLPFYLLEMERGGTYGDSQSMRPRIAGGKLRVKAPNLDVAWNQGIKPKLVRGSMDDIRIERSEALRPEITERFRQNRQEERERAVQTITALGGEEKFRLHRARELANNRQTADKRDRSEKSSRETTTRPNPAARSSAERPSAQRPPAASPPQVASRPDRAVRTPRAQAAAPTLPGNAAPLRVNRFNNDPAANREPPQAVNRPPARNALEPERTVPGQNPAPPPVADDAPRERRQQEEQAERARQQQAEEARNERARQQQQESERQQERARQQRDEEERGRGRNR